MKATSASQKVARAALAMASQIHIGKKTPNSHAGERKKEHDSLRNVVRPVPGRTCPHLANFFRAPLESGSLAARTGERRATRAQRERAPQRHAAHVSSSGVLPVVPVGAGLVEVSVIW